MESGTSEVSKPKIEFETIAEMGSGLVIAKVSSEKIREQDINARIMKDEMQKQLTDNIKKRGQLESLPFCALTQDGTRIEIISGHHRIRSGKDAGLKDFFVILDTSGLSRSKITAKQIAHNAISGFDDKATLKELAKMLDDVDDMIESYAGKEILGEPEGDLEKYLSPTVHFDWKNVLLLFLPHQIKDLEKLVEEAKKFSPDYVGVVSIEEHEPFIKALAKYQGFADVKNVSAAVHAMTKLSLQAMTDYTSETKWVPLSSLFGGSAISQEEADIIKNAIKKAVGASLIDDKHRTDFLKILAERYLTDEE